MKTKAIVPMLVGVGIGLLALKLGWNYIEKSRLSAAARQGDTPIVIARQKIPPGRPLQLVDLKVTHWPRSAVPAEAFADPEELVNRVGMTLLGADLPVLENMLAPPGTPPGLPALIPAGYQAMTVKVDEFAGVGGFLNPGDKVDVVATFNVKRTRTGGTETVTRTILRDIKVCAVGQEVQSDENNQPMVVRSVTLLVKPQQAQRLSLASTRGTIRLSLRSGQGTDPATDLAAISFDELLRNEPPEQQGKSAKNQSSWTNIFQSTKQTPTPQPAVAKVKPDPTWQVQLIRGPNTEQVTFENSHSSRRVTEDSLKTKIADQLQSRTKQGISPELSELLETELADQQEASE